MAMAVFTHRAVALVDVVATSLRARKLARYLAQSLLERLMRGGKNSVRQVGSTLSSVA
jgi:hypothetical protein